MRCDILLVLSVLLCYEYCSPVPIAASRPASPVCRRGDTIHLMFRRDEVSAEEMMGVRTSHRLLLRFYHDPGYDFSRVRVEYVNRGPRGIARRCRGTGFSRLTPSTWRWMPGPMLPASPTTGSSASSTTTRLPGNAAGGWRRAGRHEGDRRHLFYCRRSTI
ncbi:protein of unknown function [Methanoculleus bourgensis]|uniref:Uncharacterized protein n=1 Tax=Methanoculleus bourgensis TaxID=83986 RepID=A0A0X3BNP9_9EURY|nr:protein of unknown function [Methanoculleus bourgensis]